MCFSCYKAAKMFSLALLIASAPPLYTVGLLTLEFWIIFLWRMKYNNWRYYVRGVDGYLLSPIFHFVFLFSLLSAPFPTIRSPGILTPKVYAGSVSYMCIVNYVIVYVACYVFDAKYVRNEMYVWVGLTAVTSLCIISGAIAFSYIPSGGHKGTFYKHLTFKEHMSTFIWDERVELSDHKNRKVRDRDGIRALLPLRYSIHYVPKEKLIDLYREKWEKWCADPPTWFDEEFKALVPRELLVGVDESLWGRKEMKSKDTTDN